MNRAHTHTHARTHVAAYLFGKKFIEKKKQRDCDGQNDRITDEKNHNIFMLSFHLFFIIILPKNIFGNSYLVYACWHPIGWKRVRE